MKLFLIFWGLFFRYKTWKDRVEIYRELLKLIDNGRHLGFCTLLTSVKGIEGGWMENIWRLPELYWYKPFFKGKHDLWWDLDDEGMARRKAILIMAIEDFDRSHNIEKKFDPYYKDDD
jgi:hypothetical protein